MKAFGTFKTAFSKRTVRVGLCVLTATASLLLGQACGRFAAVQPVVQTELPSSSLRPLSAACSARLEKLRPGFVPVRRLNRTEYVNTIRDLFAVDANQIEALPEDAAGFSGYDTDADALALTSDNQVRQWLNVADQVIERVFTQNPNPLLTCAPASSAQNETCARQIISQTAYRVFRRPADNTEVEDLMKLYREAAAGSFQADIKVPLKAMLMAPQFLYRINPVPNPEDPASVRPLTDYELAAELSYFIWSSTPDQQLMEKARQGLLTKSEDELKKEVARLLASPKAYALADNFAGQWLGARGFTHIHRDQTNFPNWTPNLPTAFTFETILFARNVFAKDLGPTEFLTAKYTFVNQELAQYYGIPGVSSSTYVQASLPSHMQGVLTHGGVLAHTSADQRTSPVLRGAWVLGKMVCAPPPPPPPGIPALPTGNDTTEASIRDQLAAHRTNATCAGCHAQMDPIGLGMENFDGAGRHRTTYANGTPVDAASEAMGSSFEGAAELSNLLAKGDQFKGCFTKHLTTYALGREMTPDDKCLTSEVGPRALDAKGRMSDLIASIVTSQQFRYRSGEATK